MSYAIIAFGNIGPHDQVGVDGPFVAGAICVVGERAEFVPDAAEDKAKRR